MNNIEELLTQIEQLEAKRKYPAALELAQSAVQKFPSQKQLLIKLADLFAINKQYPHAIGIYKRLNDESLKSGNSELPVLLGLANGFLQNSQYQQSEKIYAELNAKVPQHPDILTGLGAILFHKGEMVEAQKLLEQALKKANGHKQATYELAKVAIERNETDKAVKLLEKNIRRSDVHGDSIDLWLSLLEKESKNRYAQEVMEQLSKDYPEIIEFTYGFAVLANRAGEITIARPAYEKALSISPENPRVYNELGVLERVAGNMELSEKYISKALDIQPDNPAALRTFGSDTKYEYGDENYKRLNYVAAKFSDFSKQEQIHLHYALAKQCEDVGETDAAFRHYEIGGRKKRQSVEYKERESARMTQIIPKVVTKENLQKSGDKGYESDVPVFILGMPRSGTSLMEQILSSHPDIFGAGELKFMTGVLENIQIYEGTRLLMGDKDPVFPYDDNASWEQRGQKYVERISTLADKPSKRIVDKMPGNFNFVGLIKTILPGAKIIHSRRHPVETCLSCYRIHFAEGHQWTYNLKELGRFYKRYWNLMKYWREEFPEAMLEVKYEENVADVESQSRKLIDYLGLEWDENCLDFYNTSRPVKTASLSQVRKPIYATSTNRWRKYEKYLQPLLEEIGDIVEEYEADIAHLIVK
jgi:tetratricopeptide (TPR) repeat protein